jgi:transketolase
MSSLPSTARLDERSRALRHAIVDTLAATRGGHVGAAFSLVEILRVLYDDVLKVRPQEPQWVARDRCILSKGHGCLALYVMLADKGFFPKAELARFTKADGILGGHPEYGRVPGVEASTGSLGHGLSIGVGLALALRLRGSASRVFVIVGDGESNEGSVWEAAMAAGKHGLGSLTVVVDRNGQQSYDTTERVLPLEPYAEKWTAFGFSTVDVDGHDVAALRDTFSRLPLDPRRPSAIICHTVKGRGAALTERDLAWHHKSRLTDEQLAALRHDVEAG